MTIEKFWSPRYNGKRFIDHTLPIDALRDLVALKELLDRLAVYHFKQQNNRKRMPSSFFSNFSLNLQNVAEGSAKPVLVILLTSTILNIQASPAYMAYTAAKNMIIKAINQADADEQITAIPREYLRKFDKIGLNLQDDEAIEFAPNAVDGKKAIYTQQTRKKLLQASSSPEVFTKNVVLRGQVDEVNAKGMTFEFSSLAGGKISSSIPDDFFDQLHKELAFCKHGGYVVITGEARYSDSHLETITNIISVDELDDLDIFVQLKDLTELSYGWLDGETGLPLDKQLAHWFEQRFSSFFPDDYPNPYLSPRPNGGLGVEWQIEDKAISFNISQKSNLVDVYFVDISKDKEDILESVDLDTEQGWQSIVALLNKEGHKNG